MSKLPSWVILISMHKLNNNLEPTRSNFDFNFLIFFKKIILFILIKTFETPQNIS